MKKLILIPSLAIATTLPALCAVSCGAVTSKWSLEDGEFVWTHGLASGLVDSNEEATDKYFNEIDKQILADDIIKNKADVILKQKDQYNKAEIEVKVTAINKEEHRISFSLSAVSVAARENLPASANLTITYTNFPVKLALKYSNDTKLDHDWMLCPVEVTTVAETKIPDFYRKDTKWSYSINAIMDDTKLNDTLNYKTPDAEEHIDAIHYCFYIAIIETSWFFQNVLRRLK